MPQTHWRACPGCRLPRITSRLHEQVTGPTHPASPTKPSLGPGQGARNQEAVEVAGKGSGSPPVSPERLGLHLSGAGAGPASERPLCGLPPSPLTQRLNGHRVFPETLLSRTFN